LLASADGWFYMFDVNTQEGGICKLLTQASIYTSNPNNQLFTNNQINSGNNPNLNQNFNNQNQNNNQNDEGQAYSGQNHHQKQQVYENNNQTMES
jgi:hypothetical protein